MKNRIEDLRNHLFETLEGLKDKENPMDIERAKAVSQVAQVIIESAKVECKFLELGGKLESDFIAGEPALPGAARLRLANGKSA